MKNKSCLYGALLVVTVMVAGAQSVRAGQNVGNGGDLVCVATENSSLSRCHLLDFIEWGMEDHLFVEAKRGFKPTYTFPPRFEGSNLINYGGVKEKVYGYYEGTATLFRPGISALEYKLMSLNDQNRANTSRSINVLAAKMDLYKTLERQSEVFQCKDYLGCITAGLVVNKVSEIEKFEPEFAKIIEQTLRELKWIPVNAELKDIKDEATFIQTVADNKFQVGTRKIGRQGAVRTGNIVRLDKEAFLTLFYPEKAGLIFHEVIYKLTVDQGDTDSARARQIVSLLFDSRGSREDSIKAAHMLFEKH